MRRDQAGDWTIGTPTADDLRQMAEAALASIPERLRRHLEEVTIFVEELPSDELTESLDLESPFDLLGLYDGISLPEKSVSDSFTPPDRIFLYRLPILDYWRASEETLDDLVRHVLIHEAGHHFGFSDADMELLEQEADENIDNAEV